MKVTGRIVDIDDGLPLDGAIIATIHDSTLSNEDGSFELITDEIDSPVVIMRTGYQTIELMPEQTSMRESFESGYNVVTWSTIPMTDDPSQILGDVSITGHNREWIGWLVLAAGIVGSAKT